MASAYTSSYFKKIILLEDWWLIKAVNDVEGKRLAVAGFTHRDTNQARRLFSSAPILKIHDVFTLETIDGIYVVLRGFMNKARTLENGFAAETLDHFIFGFPPYWKACGEKWMIEGYTANLLSRNSGKEDEGVEGFKISKEPEDNLEAGISTFDLQETIRNSPENFLDDIPTQPIADLSTGLTTWVSGLDEQGVAPSIEATNLDIGAEKDKSNSRKSQRKLKFSSCSNHTEDDNDECNSDVNLNTAENQRLDEQGVAPSIEATNLNIGAEKDKSNSRKSQRKLKFSSCSNHTEDDIDECNSDVNLNTAENQRLEVGISGLDKQGVAPPIEATNIDLVAEKDKSNTRKSQRKLKFKSCSSHTEENNDESNSDVSLNNAENKSLEEAPINRNGRESSSILSPESLSSKRSRSGRLLLPTLEFWRNQTVIYDADRHVSGVMQELPAIQPAQVRTPASVTAPRMKGKEKTGRLRKYPPDDSGAPSMKGKKNKRGEELPA